MSQCRVCSAALEPVIDFGRMPIANGFLKDPKAKEFFYNMAVGFCPSCLMVQLTEAPAPEMMFNDSYAFFSSTSRAMAEHFRGNAEEVLARTSRSSAPFIVELGCNDGIMLKNLAAKGVKHLGIEPSSNVARAARQNGVNVTEKFFNAATAQAILKEYGPADVICGSNVFCHIEDINSVFAGLAILLKPEGYVYFEDPYLWDIIQKSSFDQIYDEHVYYFSGLSVRNLAARHGLELVDMAHQEVHGGSMRYYLKRKGVQAPASAVAEWIAKEKELKIDVIDGYRVFKSKVDVICRDLKALLVDLKAKGARVVGYGATSKSTTLLNYAGIGPELIEHISDTTPTKIGRFTPGMHIPVKAYEDLVPGGVRYVLLLAWNHKKEIMAKERAFQAQGGKFITYFPAVVME
ncbi:MAG: class I SAM-dependent methyltransferase [Candidatus Omnitrophica bacterium]|nr:class I SAM-dependent methyltransferase [Candidatus Omnitrophota bacterium]